LKKKKKLKERVKGPWHNPKYLHQSSFALWDDNCRAHFLVPVKLAKSHGVNSQQKDIK
jgi:hypothetical protein